MSYYFFEMKEVTKQLDNVRVLNNFSLQVKKGEIHAVIADNEVSISAVIKIASGEYPYGSYSGDIFIDGDIKYFHSVRDSEKSGIGIIYQKPNFVSQMDISENIHLGSEYSHAGIIDRKKCDKDTVRILKELNQEFDPRMKMYMLRTSDCQKIEIARCVLKKMDIWILEDLVAALTEKEIDNLLELLLSIKDRGITIIYLGHRLKDIVGIADRFTLMREGKTIYMEEAKNYLDDEDVGINLLIGKELSQNGFIDPFCQSYEISKREKEVLQKLIEGYSNKEICEKLFISLNTLKTHIGNIYQKTSMNNRKELASLILKMKRRQQV